MSVKQVILLVLLSTLIISAVGAFENNITNTTIDATPTTETSRNTIITEEPASILERNNLLLYSLLSVITVLVLIVGSLVIGITKKHELPATTKALLREEAPYIENNTLVELSEITDQEISPVNLQTAPRNSSSQGIVIHYPSIEEARSYIQKLRDRGYSDSQIRDHFTLHGWNDNNLAIAMRH